jgi:DNA-binding beta-propeller fold protein YncE
MNLRLFAPVAAFLTAFLSLSACKNNNMEDMKVSPGTYPSAVGKIITTRCATAGCHNGASSEYAADLTLDSWQHMFEGADNGAVIVPYSPDFSSLLYFINTHADLGPVATPTMPLYQTALTVDEYMVIKNWVAAGAPDISGNIPFASNPASRGKIYMTMQGCDLVAVVDAESKLVMRYIPVGTSPAVESPHCVRVSNDGNYAYISFIGGTHIQKIDTRTDTVVAGVDVGVGQWNVFQLSFDGKQMLVSDFQGNGKLLLINTETMEVVSPFTGPGLFVYPHGIASNEAFNMFYVVAQYGNTVYRFSPNGFYKKLSLDGNPPVTTQGLMDPHEILMTPDRSKYFVTCSNSNEVRVMDVLGDTLLKVIPVGIKPQEIAISRTRPFVFVTCTEDNTSLPGYRGSVYAINYNTYETTRIEGPFFQPHGITVDDTNGLIYVLSRNASPDGPAPHHSSSCAGRNGYYSVYDLNTFQRLPKRYEVSVDPYSADSRFK